MFSKFIVSGEWGSWNTLSPELCADEPNRKVMEQRFCNKPEPKFLGAKCPGEHTREILCYELYPAGKKYQL